MQLNQPQRKLRFFVMTKFSQNLEDRLIAYFQKQYGISLTYEQTESYLDSLADFFIWLDEGSGELPAVRREPPSLS